MGVLISHSTTMRVGELVLMAWDPLVGLGVIKEPSTSCNPRVCSLSLPTS